MTREQEVNPYEPLSWPSRTPWWKPALSWHVPWGDAHVYREICDHLKRREARMESWEELWGQYPEISGRLRTQACEIIAHELSWPNHLFIPDDPVEILLFDPTPDLRSVAALAEIRHAVNCQETPPLEGVFLEFLRRLVPTTSLEEGTDT